MQQHNLAPPPGSRHRRKRVGRGLGSGHGTYSCRGTKGQKSRSGGGVHPYFEGGQLPLSKRLPYRRGFTNIFRTEYSVVNLYQLNIFEPNSEVTPQRLKEAGLLKNLRKPVKILAQGNLHKPLIVKADKFSQEARQKVELAGGRVEEVKNTAG